jgi:hypothetical protein
MPAPPTIFWPRSYSSPPPIILAKSLICPWAIEWYSTVIYDDMQNEIETLKEWNMVLEIE